MAAALFGLVVGAGVTLGIGALTGGEPSDLDTACAAVEALPDDLESDLTLESGNVDRVGGAGSLLRASAGGDDDAPAAEIGNTLLTSVSRQDLDSITEAVEDADELCADR